MEPFDIRRYILHTLFFPKVVLVNRPGIIVNHLSKRFGTIRSLRRTVYHFEDLFAELHHNTVATIGLAATQDLWYNIGKDIGSRYMLFGSVKKMNDTHLPYAIDFIFSNLRANGTSVAESIQFDPKTKTLVLSGGDNVISRKTKDLSVFSGIVSGILSVLYDTNIEAVDSYDHKTGISMIRASFDLPERYIPNRDSLRPSPLYHTTNFPPERERRFLKGPSFQDLVRFGRITIKDQAKFYLNDYCIIPSETGFVGIIAHQYHTAKLDTLLANTLVIGASNIARKLLTSLSDHAARCSFVTSLFCALGFGFLFIKPLEAGDVRVEIVFPPFCRYGFVYEALVINGFLNVLFEASLRLDTIAFHRAKQVMELTYRSVKKK